MDEKKKKALIAHLIAVGHTPAAAARIADGPKDEKEKTTNQIINELEKNIAILKKRN
jgi:nanoRNase/pAp phosphatase (c-di-AMP/oligoRNAs hydrolase)